MLVIRRPVAGSLLLVQFSSVGPERDDAGLSTSVAFSGCFPAHFENRGQLWFSGFFVEMPDPCLKCYWVNVSLYCRPG